MRVCITTTSFPRWINDGQGTFVWELAKSVASHGIQVRVITMHSPGACTYERMENVEVIRPRYWWPEKWEKLREIGGGLPIVWQQYPLMRVQILLFFWMHGLNIARFARCCDLIHAHWTLSAAAALIGRRFHKCPILVTVQGSDILQVPRQPLGALITRAVLSRCDFVIAISNALKAKVLQLGVKPHKCYVIPNGVDVSRFLPPETTSREPYILFVGSLIQRKGVRYLLQAAPEILAKFPDFRIVIVGEGPELPFLQKTAKELKIDERVSFLGARPQQEVKRLMQRAKALVLPSLEEGMGVVLVEALACGTPVIASCVDGIRDVVTPEVGILVPPADPKALSESIIKLLRDPVYWARISKNARARAESFYDWNLIAKQYINLYQKLITSDKE